MKGNKKNYDKKKNMLSIIHITKKHSINEHVIKDKKYFNTAIALSDTTYSIKHGEIQTCNSNIKRLQKNLCKPVSVVIQRLSQETFKKYLYTTKNQYKPKRSNKTRSIIRSKYKQIDILSRKFKKQTLQLNNDISNIFDTNNKSENTSLNFTNNICIDESDNDKKNDDQRINKKEVLKNVQPVVVLSNQVDENKLKSMKNVQKTSEHLLFPENIIDNNCKQNSYAHDDTKSVYSLLKMNDELPPIKEADKNEKYLGKWKYKRKYMSHEESNDILNSVKNRKKRKKKIKLHHKDLEQTIVLNNFKSIDNEVTINNLNITDSKVMLTKLENVYDNKYIINWKKKCPQQFLLYQNSQFIEQQKDSPINILPTKTIDNSNKDVTKDSESNMNTEIGLNSCILPLKYKQPKNLKVLLVKLEKLGIPLKEQNLVSKVEHSTAQYIDHFKMNFFNHSSDILVRNECEVSSTNKESIDEALTQLNPSEKENNIMIKHPLSKYAEPNPSIIQLEHNCSSPKRILQNVYNLEKFSEISSCSSEKSNVNMKYPGICTPSINEIEGISKSSKSPRIIQDEIISPKMSLLKTPLQRYLDRVPLNSSPTEVNSLTISDETLQRNTKLKETQTLPSLISKQNVFSKKCDETLKLTSEIDCENSTILQNNEKTLIDNDKQNTLEKNTDQELSQIEDLPLFIVDESSNINCLTNESTTSILKDTATKGMSVDNISTESIILHDIENSIKDIGLLNESLINKDSKKIISNGDVKTKTDVSNITDVSNTNLPKNVQTKEVNILQSNIITSDNTIPYECIACDSSFIEFKTLQSHLKKCLKKRKNSVNDNNVVLKVSKDNDNILDICSDKTESNSQELDNSSSVLSTFPSMISSISINSKIKTKKLNHENQQKDKHSRRKVFKYNNKNTQCTVCLEVFDSIISLSNHIYSHTEKELQKAYQIAKSKQGLKNGSDSNITTDSSEKTQTSTSESSSTLPVDSTTIESLQSDMENEKVENITNEIISKEKMKLNENQSKEVENSLEPSTIETNKEVSMTISTVHKRNSIKFCACHKNEFENKPSIELILLCNICNILFQTRECFEAHFENEETYLCNTKRLTSREPKLYCSICQVILYSFIGMRQHMENHLKNFQSIKLFCHICKIRFIGMGPIFNLHWFNHIRNVCYVASMSNFPKISIVDSTSEEWSIITSDQFKYLIVTEHICDVCNAQCFSKNQLKIHKSSCTENSKLPSIVPANDHKNQSIHSKLNLHLSCNICNLTFSQKSLYEEHIATHKNNLRSQYICSSATDIKKTYFCNICKNVYENLKEFMIHWQKHNMIRKSLMHNQAKTDFSNLKSYLENSKEYNTTIINNTSCQVTNHKMDFTCKICNLTFDSSEALHKHICTRNKEFPNLITVHSNNACNDSNEQKISSVYPTELEPNLIKPMIISAQLTNEIKTNDSADPVNENILEVIENENSTINQTIDSSKSLTNSKSIESVKTEFDDISVSDNRSTIDQDLESLLSISDVKTDDSNVTEINYFVKNNKSSTFMNKSEEKERTTACNVNNDLDKCDNIKDSNNKNTVIVKSTIDLKKKDVLVNNPPLSENININETQDNVKPAELKISEKNQNNFKETVKPTTFQSNNSTETSEESVKTKKYLRVKNISELIDQKLKYNSYNKNGQDGNADILTSSSVAMDLSNQKQTKNLNIEPHPVIRELNTKQNSVPGSSKAYKMIIIDHSLTEKQAVYVPHYESNSPKQGFVCSGSLEKTTCIPAPQSRQEATSQSGQKAASILKPQSGQRGIPMSVQQSTHRATPESGQRTTPIPIIPRSGQRITPISIMPQSRQKATSIPYSAQTTTLIPVPYSAQTATAMPILRSALSSSVTPFRAPYTSQSQVSNVQYASVKPVTTNPYTMNPRIIKAVTYVPSLIIQPQNVSHNQSTLIASSSSILTNSSANNYMNNTYVAQRDNIALCKTTSTSMISNLQLANNFSNQNMRMGQPHDTHSTVKMQNAVHNTCSNRTAKVMSVNMRSRNSIELYTNNEISSLPVSSDHNYYYNTSNVKYSSTNVRNLNMMQMQYSKQDNNLTNNGISVQRQSNNLLQMSTVCQPVVSDSHSVMSLQQPHVHDQPSTNVGSSQFMHSLYTCKFCPKPLHFSTVEELDYHLNLYHKFFCSICNVRLYSPTEIDIHKLKHESLLL
ncbi:putative histone-lysine N-methyltransferase 1 [Vespa velutina]|uniref:putative histone-lysine N-methyltransferase 1 n=1 Tax=Vespa velutina TaxID=202808 RepID=UPI001FB52230|nr:putative histone-lysine N-methyltransferase 1 [Vespa velutina]